MSIEEIKALEIDAVEERAREIEAMDKTEMTTEELEGIAEESEALEERALMLKNEARMEQEKRDAVASGLKGEAIANELQPKEERKMDVKEIRNSNDYIEAFAEGLKSGDYTECRTLLSTAVEGGTVAIPDFVADVVKTAWDEEMIMSRIPEMEIDGDLEINFEISGTDAVIHVEGSGAVAEEELVLGIAKIQMDSIKKWISISKKVMKLRGSAFLNYIYSEIAHKIAKKAADTFLAKVAALPAVATATSPSASVVTSAPSISAIGEAIAELSDEANDPVIIMNKRTKPAFDAARRNANYDQDIYENCEILYNNTLPAYGTAGAGDVYVIVGDLKQGALKTKPTTGDEIEFIFDEITRKKENLVEVLGEEYRGAGVVADKAFALIKKPAVV